MQRRRSPYDQRPIVNPPTTYANVTSAPPMNASNESDVETQSNSTQDGFETTTRKSSTIKKPWQLSLMDEEKVLQNYCLNVTRNGRTVLAFQGRVKTKFDYAM